MVDIFLTSVYMLSVSLARLLPRIVLLELAQFLSFFYCLLAKKSRCVVRDNLKKIMGSEFRYKYVWRLFRNFAFYFADFLKFSNKKEDFFSTHMKIDNIEILEGTFKQSQGGAIGLGMHMGNWEFCGGYLFYLGYRTTAVAMDHSVKYVDRFFKQQRRCLGMEELPFKNSFFICQQKLREKLILGLLCDRDFTGNFITATLFDQKYYIPKAPFILSLRTQVPMFLAVTVRDGLSYRTIIKGPFVYKSFTLKEMYVIVSDVTKAMQKHIKRYPDQWFTFQRFWEVPKGVVIL